MISFWALQPLYKRSDFLDKLLKRTERSGNEHGTGFSIENGDVYFSSIVTGTEKCIYLDLPQGEILGTLHTHPDQPKNPTLSVTDATTLLTEDADFAGVVGWETIEWMRKPRSILTKRAGRILTSIHARIGLREMSYLSGRAEMRMRFPLLFETHVR